MRLIDLTGRSNMKRERWVNFYPPTDFNGPANWATTSWVTRDLADENAKRGRLACIEVRFRDGDGLSEADQRTVAS
jgi:hypothetical protein